MRVAYCCDSCYGSLAKTVLTIACVMLLEALILLPTTLGAKQNRFRGILHTDSYDKPLLMYKFVRKS